MGRRILRWFGAVVGIGLVGAASYGGFLWFEQRKVAAVPAAAEAPRPIRVTVETVAQRDVAIQVEGIGTVQGLNTVTLRSRVDGAIAEVAFKEGQTVKAGDILFRIDPRPYKASLDQAKARLAQSQSGLNNLRLDLERARQLVERGVVSRQQADTQQAQVNTMMAQMEADRAQIEAAQAQLDYTTIKSPIDGRVGLRMIDAGNMASGGTPLVLITQIRPITVLFTLPESTLQPLSAAMKRGPVPVVVTGRDMKKPLARGQIDFVDNQVDSSTGTIKVKSTIENEDLALWPGQFINVKVEVEVLKGRLTVPSAAVQSGPNGEYVYVVGADKTVEVRTIQAATRHDGLMVVSRGLRPGEVIVTDGGFRLRPGAAVIPVPARPATAAADRPPS